MVAAGGNLARWRVFSAAASRSIGRRQQPKAKEDVVPDMSSARAAAMDGGRLGGAPGMRRHEAGATCLSWIPPTAVQGVFSLPFGLGITHYDQPPPDELPDVEQLLATDAIRFANQLHAWIEVEDGRVTSYGMSGQGRLGSTTVRLRAHGLTFA